MPKSCPLLEKPLICRWDRGFGTPQGPGHRRGSRPRTRSPSRACARYTSDPSPANRCAAPGPPCGRMQPRLLDTSSTHLAQPAPQRVCGGDHIIASRTGYAESPGLGRGARSIIGYGPPSGRNPRCLLTSGIVRATIGVRLRQGRKGSYGPSPGSRRVRIGAVSHGTLAACRSLRPHPRRPGRCVPERPHPEVGDLGDRPEGRASAESSRTRRATCCPVAVGACLTAMA